MTAAIETDALIVGAGPVGLFQVFELGLLEVRAHVVDSLPFAGGQCVELYADKPIYDVPALPMCTGRELVDRLLRQIEPFSAPMHLNQQVCEVEARGDGRFHVATDAGQRFDAKAIVVAGGVGSFQPRKLKVVGLERWQDTQVFDRGVEEVATKGLRVVVVGNGEAAVSAALAAARSGAASVTLVHRRDDFDAPEALLERLCELRAANRVAFCAGRPTAIVEQGGRLTGLQVDAADLTTQTIPLDVLFVLLGWSPKLGPIAAWGLALDKKQVAVDTTAFATSTPGIYAVGDVNVYPGKRKLIVSGFHEATLAAYAIAERVHPDRAQPLLYTTTSPKLHRLLGVATNSAVA